MTIAYRDPLTELRHGDALDVLAEMEPESVQCVVTSPPYWGLRKYAGDGGRVWGPGGCEHEWADSLSTVANNNGLQGSTLTGGKGLSARSGGGGALATSTCHLCGAWRGSYGLEPLHDCLGWARVERCWSCYVCHTLAFLDALWRVLRRDGVVFWNLGDSYSGGGGYYPDAPSNQPEAARARHAPGAQRVGARMKQSRHPIPGLKPKDMVLIPQRIALAAQAAGWWMRSDIIWAKPNPMPESTRDRPTSSYEHILMLTKASRYYWDAEAVRETIKPESVERYAQGYKGSWKRARQALPGDGRPEGHEAIPEAEGRNLRDVWTFATQPYPEAHFATFPEALPRRCIMAATSERGACPVCGAPWERVVEKMGPSTYEEVKGDRSWKDMSEEAHRRGTTPSRPNSGQTRNASGSQPHLDAFPRQTLGWRPTCQHEGDPVPCVVLDPFAGASTTGVVAKGLGRRSILAEISRDYAALAARRLENTQPSLFAAPRRE